MFSKTMKALPQDVEAAKKLADFLPDKIFDAHAHLFDTSLIPSLSATEKVVCGMEEYKNEMSELLCFPKELHINMIGYPDKAMAKDVDLLLKTDEFLKEQLKKDDLSFGEILVTPDDTVESIEKRLTHDRIRGFKCYHLMAKKDVTWNSSIGEYLPEAAWHIADQKRMCITLHMVKDKALADEDNLGYIRTMAKKYPNAVLILAHAARSFASWTGIESVEKVSDLENVWFDFSAVCESPAMLQIVKKAGISRCMWGSDYPVCRARGKAISFADTFYWIYQKDIDNFSSKTPVNNWLIALENLFAVKQLAELSDLNRKDVEDLFYNNAMTLFNR